MAATLNALRRFLRDSGCVEERVLRSAGREGIFIELVCRMKIGKACRAILAADAAGGTIPEAALRRLGRLLAPCLGRGWTQRIPAENPFG